MSILLRLGLALRLAPGGSSSLARAAAAACLPTSRFSCFSTKIILGYTSNELINSNWHTALWLSANRMYLGNDDFFKIVNKLKLAKCQTLLCIWICYFETPLVCKGLLFNPVFSSPFNRLTIKWDLHHHTPDLFLAINAWNSCRRHQDTSKFWAVLPFLLSLQNIETNSIITPIVAVITKYTVPWSTAISNSWRENFYRCFPTRRKHSI